MAYYYTGRSGDPFTETPVHTDADCADDPTRPIAESTVKNSDGVTFCGECADGEGTDTCEVVKSDGDVCGRERPCTYHD